MRVPSLVVAVLTRAVLLVFSAWFSLLDRPLLRPLRDFLYGVAAAPDAGHRLPAENDTVMSGGEPFQHRHLPGHDGTTQLHVVECGEVGSKKAKLMVLLHGWPESPYSWRHVMRRYAEEGGWWLVAVEMRGFGYSSKPTRLSAYSMAHLVRDVEAVITGLGRQQCDVLMAHDWGGVVAWRMAHHLPQRIGRMVVCNAPHWRPFRRALLGWDGEQSRRSWYIFAMQLPWLMEWRLRGKMGTLIRNTFTDRSRFDPDTDGEHFRRSFDDNAGALRASLAYYRNLFRLSPQSAEATAVEESGGKLKPLPQPPSRKIQVPVHLVWGEDDVALGREIAIETAQECESMSLHFVPNCSHWVQQERPDEVLLE